MLYSQSMTEVEMVVPAKDLISVTNALAEQGTFHQADARYLSSEAEPDSLVSWQETASTYATLERRILVAMQALDVTQEPLSPAEDISMIEIASARVVLEQIEGEIQAVNVQLIDSQKRLEQLNSYLRQMGPIADIDLDIKALYNPQYIFSRLGVIPAGNVERLQTSLKRIPFVLLTLREDAQKPVVWLAGARRDADILDRAARSAYLDPLELPPIHHGGTPADIIASLHTAIERAQEHLAEQEVAIKALREEHEEQLQALLWRVRASRMLASAISRFGRLRYTYLIIGWVPSRNLAGLIENIKQISGETLIDTIPTKRSGSSQDIPIALRNPGIVGVFQTLVTAYAEPRYEEIDPTLLMAITFPLLFGAMFGDVGHGLVLALLGWLLASRRIKALNSMASLGPIIVMCGLSATLFGFLYGSVFGQESVLPALWIRPLDNIMQILIVSVGAGIVLLSLGLLLNMLNAWMARDWGKLLFSQNGVAGAVLYWSLIGLLIAAFTPILSISPLVFVVPVVLAGLVVMFSEVLNRLLQGHRPLVEGGLGTYFVQAAFEMFETLISLLSNSLSYVRVGAFAVAHGGLSAVILILAAMVSPARGIGYWIVAAIGSLFIVGFEGLIVGIQTMRLEYYEFFCKFFGGGGKPYKPLTLQPTTSEQSGVSA